MKKLWYGGTIYSMIHENETVEAVLVEAGRIIETGNYADLAPLADEKVDLQGAAMYPGFVDSHLHMIKQGEKLVRLDLSAATSKNEMLEMIKQAAEQLPLDEWLFGEGWNEHNFLNQEIPSLKELDAIRKAPIVLMRVCHHAILANSSAIAASGITNQTTSPSGGKIERNEQGELTGVFYEQAMSLITNTIPKSGEAYVMYLKKVLNLAINQMTSLGLTGGHTEDMAYFGDFMNPFRAFKELISKQHHFKVNLLRHHDVFEAMVEADLPYEDSFIEAGAMKIFLDGSLGAATAALTEPYADDAKNKGLLIYSDEEVIEMVKLARKYHTPVAIHVIGDAAAEQALRVLEAYPVAAGKRDRLIHGSVLKENLIERIKQLPLVIDIQPAFVPSDFPWIIDVLGSARLNTTYPWKTLLDADIYLAAGTDAPIEDIDPLKTIYAAIERKEPSDLFSHQPDQKVSRYQAIQMYTLGSAQAISQEAVRGLIKQGYEADFSIFDRDLFTGRPEELLQAKAVQTVVAGEIVYNQLNQ